MAWVCECSETGSICSIGIGELLRGRDVKLVALHYFPDVQVVDRLPAEGTPDRTGSAMRTKLGSQ
jgi:hypothetical protein